tara:strand:- start:571 stop:933 length:363 start_codon:yes stop_codon:yes gene_type:complete
MRLVKKIYNAESAENVIDRSFNELSKSKALDNVSISKFFKLYDKLFLTIPKEGPNSHSFMVDKSGNFIGNAANSKDREIEKLKKEIKQQQMHITDLEESNRLLTSDNKLKENQITNLKGR